MKKACLFAFYCFLAFFQNVYAQTPSGKIPKETREHLRKMLYIEGGRFVMGNGGDLTAMPKDSLLLLASLERVVTVSGFWMSETEVTRGEWRQFYEHIKNIAGADSASRYIPSASSFEKEFPYTLTPFAGSGHAAFFDPVYSDHPVVGISWEQAQAYCRWLSAHINGAFAAPQDLGASKNEARQDSTETIFFIPDFRLPTEAEWEYAALPSVPNSVSDAVGNKTKKSKAAGVSGSSVLEQRRYPWEGKKLADGKGDYFANFGPIIDQNGLWLKNFDDDNALKSPFTTPVRHYPPNGFGLYDMAGNAREFVADHALFVDSESFLERNPFRRRPNLGKDTLYTAVSDTLPLNEAMRTLDIAKIRASLLKSKPGISEKDLEETGVVERYFHDAKALYGGEGKKVVKGGSWLDGPAYLMGSSRVAFPQNSVSWTTGFRVAMIHIGGENPLRGKKGNKTRVNMLDYLTGK